MGMEAKQLDGLYMWLLGCVAFLALGFALENASAVPMVDFKVLYYPARCLLHHCDPYDENRVLAFYTAEAADPPSSSAQVRQIVARCIYLPTAFSVAAPFAMLPWGPAHLLWMAFTAGSLIFASFLIWDLGARHVPVVSGILVGFFLANCESLLVLGNAAAIAVSLCVIAVWCLLQEKFIAIGIVCLAISLAVKPQDAGLIWLYFLLVGGTYRKRALQCLLATIAIGLPELLWTWHIAPNWIQEWHSNLAALSAHGGLTDPGPASLGSHGLGMQVNLQAAISLFRDDPRIYNPASWIVFGPLLLIWIFITLRYRPSPAKAWLAIASIATLSMLPVYHHLYDAKLLLATVPACSMLWAGGGLTGRIALLTTAAGFVLTGDLPWAIFLGLIQNLHLSVSGTAAWTLMAAQVFPVPIILLVMSIFYLYVYSQQASDSVEQAQSAL